MQSRKLFAIEVTSANNVKCLAFKLSKFNNELFFCEGNGGGKFTSTPAPELYTSRKQALAAIDTDGTAKPTNAKKIEKTFARVVSIKKIKIVPVYIAWGRAVSK